MREVHRRGGVRRARGRCSRRRWRRAASSSPSSFEHPERGPVAAQSDYVPWVNPDERRGRRRRHRHHRHHRATRDRAGAARERGAVQADRQFGAGDDVGDPARPRARLRQRRLCRFRRAGPGATARGGADARLAHAHPPRRRRPDRRREHRRRSDAASRSRSRAATSAATANGAGSAACRSRASAPDGELVGFIGVATDITLAKEAELELRRQVEEQTARAGAQSKRSSARCSRRRSR